MRVESKEQWGIVMSWSAESKVLPEENSEGELMESAAIVTAILPIGAVITAVAQEVLNTAIAAQDVLVDQESFRLLSRYLEGIHGVLNDFQRRDLTETPAIRSALGNMRSKVVQAQAVIESAKGKSRFYLLMHCRSIVEKAQTVTRGIGEALQLLLIAGAEIQMHGAEHVHKLKDQMLTAEFEASAAQSHVMDELERGLRLNKTDRGFANDLLRDIARAVGVPNRQAELRSELSSFQREMEEVVLQKRDQEQAFMEQVITILNRTDAASPAPEDSYSKYRRLAQMAEGAGECYPPFPSFICPLTHEVMQDPVILGSSNRLHRHDHQQSTEFTYERAALVTWLEEGGSKRTDPCTGAVLSKVELRPNNSLRESIKEWVALNEVIRIRTAMEAFLSGDENLQTDALLSVCECCEKNLECKSWAAAEGFLKCIVNLLSGSSGSVSSTGQTPGRRVSKFMQGLCLDTVLMMVTDDDRNKELFAEVGGLIPIMTSLSRTQCRSKAAQLLRELSTSSTVCSKIPDIQGAVLSLVTLFFHYEKDPDTGGNLRVVLDKLSEESDKNVVAMANANWCYPLITRISTGSEASKVCMANYLADTPVDHISEDSKTLIAEGAISPLVRMCESGKVEAKMAGVRALSNLSSCTRLRNYVAAAEALPVVLQLQVSLMYPIELRERAASVFANLCSGSGIKYFIDAKKGFLPLYNAVEPFLHFPEEGSSVLRLHVLRALLGMAQEAEARQLIRAGKGVPVLLSLLQLPGSGSVGSSSPDVATRDCAVRLLFLLSREAEGAREIAAILEEGRALAGELVRLLGEHVDPKARSAAAGILSNLPLDDGNCLQKLKSSLLAAGVLATLDKLTSCKSDVLDHDESSDTQENALGALRRLTGPADLEAQQAAARLGIVPKLVDLLQTGSLRTKARAAQILRNFSLNTSRLVSEPDFKSAGLLRGWMCFSLARNYRQSPLCTVHKGVCSVSKTFCLIEAKAVSPLVSLLEMANAEAAEAGVEALETLVAGNWDSEMEVSHTGVVVLHEVQGIQPLFSLLAHGSPVCSAKVVRLLGHILTVPRMKELYKQSARLLWCDVQ